MSKPTPTPWTVYDNIGRKSELGITASAAPCIIAVMGNQREWPIEAEANAAHIVRCVNSFDDLVAALEYAKEILESYKNTRVGVHDAAIEKARAALKQVKGE